MRPLLSCLLACAAARVAIAAAAAPIELSVDASEASRRILHARLTVPASPGPLTLVYPKWIPGEHGPSGPITDLVGLQVKAGGKAIAWRRDPLDMYAFRVEVPAGASAIEVSFDQLSPANADPFSSNASANEHLAVLSWNQILLYPDRESPGTLSYRARLRLPAGWKFGTALPVASTGPEGVEFSEVPLRTLIDSPVAMGAHHRVLPLAPSSLRPSHEIDLFADSEAALAIPDDLRRGYDRLIEEALQLFGAHHYDRYIFLLTLSDNLAHFGLEHHESSDNRSYERALVDPDRRRLMIGLLPHELVHSWNGKYRRPADLTLDDFRRPANTDLLWVYEGLSSYLGEVLSARSGLRSPEEAREQLAWLAAVLENTPGRTWRPLVDTAVAAQLLFEAPAAWQSWRRSVDFYDEGVLIWLETDVLIRQKTGGKRSLDDFCRLFLGGESGPPAVRTYTFDDVVAALQQIAPHDWRAFFLERITSTAPRAPLGGIEGAGFKLVYDAEPSQILKSQESVDDTVDLRFSIGIVVDKDGTIGDVVPGLPAARAGIAPGMKLVAVNGRRWSKDRLRDALRGAGGGDGSIDLLIENADTFRTFTLAQRASERYPHLVRDPARPDLLSEIFRPRVASQR